MDLSTFFEKFDQFADAPDAVPKLRELVLELAASGRLLPEALERPVKDDTTLMGPLVELIMGQAPAGSECNTDGLGTVFVKVGEFGPLYPREEVWTTAPLKFAKRGDVLVCVVGATVGKLNLAIDCAIGRSVAAIRPSAALDTKFLYYSLIPYTLHLRRNSRGSAQGVIGKAELNAVSLWVPSRSVQKRIVAKADELMALCDRLEAQQQERETRHAALARAALSRFAAAPTVSDLKYLFAESFPIAPADLRKSILTLAVQGLIVPHDSGSTTWETRKLSELTSKIGSGSTPSGGKAAYQDSGVPLIRSMNVHFAGFVREGLAFLNQEQAEKLKNVTVRTGDVLLNITGASIGRVTIAPDDMDGARVNQHVCIVRPTAEMLPSFLQLFLASPLVQDLIDNVQVGATREALTKAMIEDFEIPVPPLAEQRRIVAKVEQLMALVDALEQQLAASRAAAEKLLTALVAELTNPISYATTK